MNPQGGAHLAKLLYFRSLGGWHHLAPIGVLAGPDLAILKNFLNQPHPRNKNIKIKKRGCVLINIISKKTG
jgi:hypothetical protein